MQKYLVNNFDDIRILPAGVSDVNSRSECDTTVRINNIVLPVPIIVASMHSIVSQTLIDNVYKAGGAVIQPRNVSYWTEKVKPYILSSSLDTAMKRADSLIRTDVGADRYKVLAIEIANGHMRRMYSVVDEIKRSFPTIQIWAGTVCTYEGVKNLADSGADAAIVGIGSGLVCETTLKTGVGLPPMATIEECMGCDIPIILAGGVRKGADFVKALAYGADAVISGGLFSDCYDTANPGNYWGEASRTAKGHSLHIEGKHITVDVVPDKSSGDVVQYLKEALQSAMSYVGAKDMTQFRSKVHWAKVVE